MTPTTRTSTLLQWAEFLYRTSTSWSASTWAWLTGTSTSRDKNLTFTNAVFQLFSSPRLRLNHRIFLGSLRPCHPHRPPPLIRCLHLVVRASWEVGNPSYLLSSNSCSRKCHGSNTWPSYSKQWWFSSKTWVFSNRCLPSSSNSKRFNRAWTLHLCKTINQYCSSSNSNTMRMRLI